MGNELSNGSSGDLKGMKRYHGMSPGQVLLIKEKIELMADEDLTIDRAAFAQLMKLKENEVDKIFQLFDPTNEGRIDSHEFICALSLLSQATLKEKTEIIFSLYDFDHNRIITKNELVILIKTTVTALGAMSERSECSIQQAEQKAEELLSKCDTNRDQVITQKEFYSFISKDAETLKLLFAYGIICSEDLRADFGGYEQGDMPDPDSDLEQEVHRSRLAFDSKTERKKVGNEHKQGHYDEEQDAQQVTSSYQQYQESKRGNNSRQWLNQVKDGAPSNWKPSKSDVNPPTAWIDLDYVYGFRCFDSRNNIKFTLAGDLVYPIAAVVVALDTTKNVQQFMLEHTDDITCIDVFENLIVTGQVGREPLICVWQVGQVSRAVFRGHLRNGVSNVAFSPDGKKIVAVGMDPEHCIVVYDVDKALSGRGTGKRDDFLVSSGSGPRSDIFDVKLSDKNIILACKNELHFGSYDNFNLKLSKGLWDPKICPLSTVLCIGIVDSNVISGTFRGNLILWRGNRATQSIEAHKGPVLAMHTKRNVIGFMTGGRDGFVMHWDATMKLQSKVQVSELNLRVLNARVCSVSENFGGTVQVYGTRGGDMIECAGAVKRLVMQGHSEGVLRGLTVHPKLQQFYTMGEDNLLACWFLRDKRMASCVRLDYPSRAMHISPDARFLAVGCSNGTILIVDPKTLVPTFNFKDRDTEISCIKFSHDTEILAVGHVHPLCEILLYSIKNHFKRTNVLRGSEGTILSIDFSINCRTLQVNDDRRAVIYYELGGEGIQKVQPDGAVRYRDEKWATYTAVYGWQVQGIWPDISGGGDINAVDRSTRGDILVTADDYSSIKLFKFPAARTTQAYQRFSGHAAHVSNVRFTYDDEYILSLGGADKSIFQWKFCYSREAQMQQDAAEDTIPDVVVRPEYLRLSLMEDEDNKQEGQMKQYLGPIKTTIPTNYVERDELPQGHLSLAYVFGVKTQNPHGEALNLIKYVEGGRIVYPAGGVCVVMETNTQKRTQSFFRLHQQDISAIAIHPKRVIVASGGRAFAMRAELVSIYIWDSLTKQVLSHLSDFHLTCISAMQFTPDGAYLVSLGQDPHNSIAVHDWSTNQLLCTAKTGSSPIYALTLRSQNEFLTCDQKSVKFFTMQGRNLKCQSGTLVEGQFEPMTVIAVAFGDICVTGSLSGMLYSWKGDKAQKGIPAHDGKVTCLLPTKQQLYSAGLDGKVIVWTYKNTQLSRVEVLIDTMQLIEGLLPHTSAIISMDTVLKNIVIGTRGAQIYEIALEPSVKAVLLMEGHHDGELWGLACSPHNQKCVTCGGDSMLRLWDLDSLKMLMVSKPFENDIRAVDWSPSGNHIIVADVKGFIYLCDAGTLTEVDRVSSKFTLSKSRTKQTWIQDIKFSPDGTKIAFGAHTQASHLEVWDVVDAKLTKQMVINVGLQGQLMLLDWATDNMHVVLNSSNYELKFVDAVKGKDVPGPTVKDLTWWSWTCVLGQSVQGIYATKEEYDVVSTCASHSRHNLVVGQLNGQVSLFTYPASTTPAQHRDYGGHASPVTRLRFSHDDSYLISVSQLDRCVFVWQTDFGHAQLLSSQVQLSQAQLSSQQLSQSLPQQYLESDDLGLMQEKLKRVGAEKYGKVNVKDDEQQDEFGVEQSGDQGDQFMAVKPWLGALREPSNYYKDALNQGKAPLIDLQLDYVHGYRSKDCRNNIKYLKSGAVVYNAAALGVMLDPQLNTQKYFSQHDDDVLCMDVHPDRIRVATGQSGAHPIIYVWDSNTQQVICQLKSPLTRGITALAFNTSGDKLAAVALDQQIAIFDVTAKTRTGGLLLHTDRLADLVTDLKWKSDSEFTSIGINHLKMWSLTVGGLKGTRATLSKTGSTRYLCGAFNVDDCVVGALDGSLQVYRGGEQVVLVQCHELGKALEAIHVTKEFIVTGGRDGRINIMESRGTYKVLLSIKLADVIKGALLPEIKSLQLSPDQRTILVGTAASDIYEITTKDAKLTPLSKFQQFKLLLKGHYCPNKKSLNEVWGLATNPIDQDQFYSCSDDGTLRAWSISLRKMTNITRTNLDASGAETKLADNGDLSDSCKGRTIGVSPDGVYIVVGFRDGTLRVYEKDLKQKMMMKCAKDWISELKFSPDSQTLAIGSHDNSIYLYSFPDMKMKNKPLKKHSSYITHMDFSNDGNFLHSNCGAYELLFWDVQQGKQLPSGATSLRDEKWNTWTSTLGWPVQGIWPELADGTDINTVDRSHATISGSDKPPDNYNLLASGDDMSNIKLFRYPCIKKGSQFVKGRGHSSHITNVRFSNDDTYLMSAGGEDNCVIQWKIIKKR